MTSHRVRQGGSKPQPGEPGRGRRLLIALALNVGVTAAQVVGGLISGSLSLLADAAHNGSDAVSLGIAYVAWRLGRRPADARHTFGHRRAETIGALINLTTLLVIGLYLLYRAVDRFLAPEPVQGWTMVIVGAIAFLEDAASVCVLRHDRGNLNVRSAIIHLVADTLSTLGVIVGGTLILLAGLTWIDPAVTALIALYVLVHGSREIRRAISALMDTAPAGLDVGEVTEAMARVDGVDVVHHVHLWQPDEERVALEAHVGVSERDLAAAGAIRDRIKQLLRERFRVDHVTVELEYAQETGHEPTLLPGE